MIGESFKQQCPTCEAMVLIKSAGLVGKKMECPKCKDQFVVAKPASRPLSDSGEVLSVPAPAKPNPSSATAKNVPAKPKARESHSVEDAKPASPPAKPKSAPPAKNVPAKPKVQETYGVEDDDKPLARKPSVKKPAADDDDEYEEIAKPPTAVKKAPAKQPVEDEDEYEEIAKPPVLKKGPVKPKVEDEEEEIAAAVPDDDDEEEIAAAEPDEDEEEETPKKPLARIKPKPAVEDEEEETSPSPLGKGKSKLPAKAKSTDDEEQEEPPADEAAEESESAEAKKPVRKIFGLTLNFKKLKGLRPTSRKTAIGAGLGIVGILALLVAAYMITFGSSGGGSKIAEKQGSDKKPDPKKAKPLDVKEIKTTKPPENKSVENPNPAKKENLVPGFPANLPELTNLLPAESEQVVRLNFANLFDRDSPFYEAAFKAFGRPGPFNEKIMEKKLGFSLLRVDEVIQSERFPTPSTPGWSFTIVHVMDNLDIASLTRALNLQKVKDTELKVDKKPKDPKAPAINVDYYQVGTNRWLDELGRLAPGVSPGIRQLARTTVANAPGSPRPLYLHLRDDRQTLILADKQPLIAHLQDQIRKASEKPAGGGSAAFATLKSALLKNALDRLQPKDANKDRVLFVSATLMQNAAVRRSEKMGDLIQYRPRPFWDITALMEERNSRITAMGITLLARDKQPAQYHYQTDLTCLSIDHARDLAKELDKGALPQVRLLLEQFLKVKFEQAEGDKGKADSRIGVTQNGSTVNFVLDLNLERQGKDNPARNLDQYLALVTEDAHAELEFFEENNLLHQLGRAGRKMVEEPDAVWRRDAGLRGRGVGQYPPGAFPLTSKGTTTPVRDPGQRISWMAALLPYLEHQGLYDKIRFDAPWNDPFNGPAGRTLVPQFIDPSYPENTRYVQHPDYPMAYGATHFVGVAGFGLDAGDPVLGERRGILGYESSATLDEVASPRGLSNTMLMIQVPYDSPAGFSPWIAGGGGTLRGVPETNCIEPFVAKDGKGTYVLMADGSVRFVTRKVGDAVMQSMSTVQGLGVSIEANRDVTRVPEPAEKKGADPTP